MTRFLSRIWDRLHPDTSPNPDTGPVTTSESQLEAKNALESAQTTLDRVIGNKPGIFAKAESLRIEAQRNHFAELIEAAMRGAG